MNGMVLLLALAAPGIDYGWRPGADGQLEYIVQLEPELVEALRLGREVRSDIHPQARGMRRFIIRQGTGELPQSIGETSRVAQREATLSSRYAQSASRYGGYGGTNSAYVVQSARIPDTSDELPEGVQTGWRSTDTGQLEYIIQLDSTALETLKSGGQLIGDVDAEIASVGRLLVRYGSEPPPRVGVAMASGSDRANPDARGSVLRTQGETPVVMQGSPPTSRSATGSSQGSNQRSIYGTGNDPSSTSSLDNSMARGANSTANSAPQDPRLGPTPSSSGQPASGQFGTGSSPSPSSTSPVRPGSSPWTNAANAGANLLGAPVPGGNAAAGASSGATGAGSRPGTNPGLLQAPPTDGFTYSASDDEDRDDEWTIARGQDRGWQPQGANPNAPLAPRDSWDYRDSREYQDERSWRDGGPQDRAGTASRDDRQPPQGAGSDPYGDRYGRYDDSRSPQPGTYDDRRYLESERFASTGGPPPADRVTRASAESVSERELALERELAQERQKALERRLAEQERALASIATRAARRPDMIDDAASGPRTTNASRESIPDERPSPAARLGNARSTPGEGGGDLLKELVLFASLGMNIVAVLIARQYYMRYRMLIREMRDPDSLPD